MYANPAAPQRHVPWNTRPRLRLTGEDPAHAYWSCGDSGIRGMTFVWLRGTVLGSGAE